jgi:hypothetical protein
VVTHVLTSYAVPLGEATTAGPLAALVVTVVLLLLLGAVFWSFLRRSRRDGVAPLAVDRLEPRHLPEPPDPTELPRPSELGEDGRPPGERS